MKNLKIESFNGYQLNCYLHDNVKKPKGVVQIIHGMQEHALRYNHVAEFFNKNGLIVLASDLRAHGFNCEVKELGQGENIYENTVADQLFLTEYLSEKYKDLPIYIYAHSFGSFVAQRYIEKCHISKKVVLSGTASPKNASFTLGNMVASVQSAFLDDKKTAKFIESLSLKGYSKGFDDGNWLCTDGKVWEEYQKDERCGTPFPISFYKSMFKGFTQSRKYVEDIDKNIEIFLIAGKDDPVGAKGKDIENLTKFYNDNGIKAHMHIYEGMRHELHNEPIKYEVLQEVVDFYLKDEDNKKEKQKNKVKNINKN